MRAGLCLMFLVQLGDSLCTSTCLGIVSVSFGVQDALNPNVGPGAQSTPKCLGSTCAVGSRSQPASRGWSLHGAEAQRIFEDFGSMAGESESPLQGKAGA